jgi:hypothetical protein
VTLTGIGGEHWPVEISVVQRHPLQPFTGSGVVGLSCREPLRQGGP